MTHDTTLKYIIILSQGHLERYHVIFFHPLRLVNIHLILGHVQETQADWFHSKKCKKTISVMDTKIYTIDCHYIINMLKENLLKFHASFQLYDKKLTKSTLYQLSA